MIFSISGEINSGKDTVGKIIQVLTRIKQSENFSTDSSIWDNIPFILSQMPNSDWDKVFTFEIKKFADPLKDMVCLLLNCTRKQLEDREFKEEKLGEEWRIFYATSYKFKTDSNPRGRISSLYSTKEEVIEKLNSFNSQIFENYQINTEILTPRKLLQILGTECGRNLIHPNIWVNALFSKYNSLYNAVENGGGKSNWIITDTRFPNELKAVKDRGGISIKVERDIIPIKEETYTIKHRFNSEELPVTAVADLDVRGYDDLVFVGYDGIVYRKANWKIVKFNQHSSDTALNNAIFDYTISNNGTIEELVIKIKEILIKENIL